MPKDRYDDVSDEIMIAHCMVSPSLSKAIASALREAASECVI